MFFQKLPQVSLLQVLFFDELQPHDVAVCPGIVEFAVSANLEQAAKAKPPLRPRQMQQQCMRLLRLDRRPRLALARKQDVDDLLIVPQELACGRCRGQQLAELFEQFGFPFVICARENKKEAILAAFPRRLRHTRAREVDVAIEEICKIAHLRLLDAVSEE